MRDFLPEQTNAGHQERSGNIVMTGPRSPRRRRARPADNQGLFTSLAQLTPAQSTLLRRIAQHGNPVTVAELADESGLHPSSIRETLETLIELRLVSGVRLPVHGRGRPATGYLAITAPDLVSPDNQMALVTRCFFDWLRDTPNDRIEAAHQVGALIGQRALDLMRVPAHAAGSPDWDLAHQMLQIRMVLTAFGMAPTPDPSHEATLVLRACPFTAGEQPSLVGLALRHGFVQRIVHLICQDSVQMSFQPDDADPYRCAVILTLTDPQPEETMTTIRYFGGAVDAAGCTSETYERHGTLAGLLAAAAQRHPDLEPVLAVSTFLIDQRPAQRDQQLDRESVVEVLPPFAGG